MHSLIVIAMNQCSDWKMMDCMMALHSDCCYCGSCEHTTLITTMISSCERNEWMKIVVTRLRIQSEVEFGLKTLQMLLSWASFRQEVNDVTKKMQTMQQTWHAAVDS